MDIRRGIIRAFDSGTYLADVQIVGSMATMLTGVPVAKQIGADLLMSGTKCGVLFFDETDPSDPCVAFVYDGAPAAWITGDLLKDPLTDVGDIKQASGKDIYPDSETSMSLFKRLVNSVITPTDHFRSGNIPTGFAWASAPFVTPGTIAYNQYGTYMRTIVAKSGERAFLYDSISSWQGRQFVLRAFCQHSAAVGIRFDDGSDNNYVEAYLDSTVGGLGTQTMRLRQRTGGGAVTTTDTFASPRGTPHTFRMYCYAPAPPNWTSYVYNIAENGDSCIVTNHVLVTTWTPSRVGILIHEGVVGKGAEVVDWFYSTFS
jgi:hypothetical protein